MPACFYPAPLRSFLMYLAVTGVYRAKWTNMIHEEWMSSVRTNRPDMTQARVERIRDLMNANAPDCLVTGYESLIPTLYLPDPDDRHVLAAAIHGGAELIITVNLADFPPAMVAGYGVKAEHPDDFIHQLFQTAPELVCEAASLQRASLKNPPLAVDAYLASLERHGLRHTVAALRASADEI